MRLIPIVGAYKSSTYGSPITSTVGSSGATLDEIATDPYNDVNFTSIQATQLSGDGYVRRSYTLCNWHGFLDPDNLDDALQLRLQDTVQFSISSGTNAWALVGPFSGYEAVNLVGGLGWMTDLDGYWRSVILDTVRYELPIRTLRSIQHTSLDYTDVHTLGLIADGVTRTLYWIADGVIIDWYTPIEGIGAFVSLQGLNYIVYVDDAQAKLRLHGGGDSHILAIGQPGPIDLQPEITDPVITVEEYGWDWVQLSSSTYVHSTDSPHLASQWQITLDADTLFESPVVDTGWHCQFLEEYINTGELLPETDYRARVRYIAEDGITSDWADAGTFTTKAEGIDPSTPWTNTGAPCQPGEVIPVTPWDKPGC